MVSFATRTYQNFEFITKNCRVKKLAYYKCYKIYHFLLENPVVSKFVCLNLESKTEKNPVPHYQSLVDLHDPFPNDDMEKSVIRVDTREPDIGIDKDPLESVNCLASQTTNKAVP